MQASDGQRDGSGGASALGRRHARVAAICGGVVVSMAALSYAAVPLYRLFCQMTGYGGTPKVASQPSNTVLDRTITVRFDANVGGGLGWQFEPVQRTMQVRIGDNVLAHYRATNLGEKPSKGTASYNVSPDVAASFFNKIECFCFTEQALAPGESIEMPVSFFVDPKIVEDSDAGLVSQITLSYTFYPVAGANAAQVVRSSTEGPAPAGRGGT
jgi:cytochrome c oxidase assembly protein subunit 11